MARHKDVETHHGYIQPNSDMMKSYQKAIIGKHVKSPPKKNNLTKKQKTEQQSNKENISPDKTSSDEDVQQNDWSHEITTSREARENPTTVSKSVNDQTTCITEPPSIIFATDNSTNQPTLPIVPYNATPSIVPITTNAQQIYHHQLSNIQRNFYIQNQDDTVSHHYNHQHNNAANISTILQETLQRQTREQQIISELAQLKQSNMNLQEQNRDLKMEINNIRQRESIEQTLRNNEHNTKQSCITM